MNPVRSYSAYIREENNKKTMVITKFADINLIGLLLTG